MIKGAPLPALGNRVGVGAKLVRLKPLQMITLAVKHPHVRTKELISRTHQEIAVERADIDGPVRCVMNRVNVSHRAALVGEANNLLHVINRAYGIRSVTDRNQFGPVGDLALQIGQVESAVVFMNLHHAYGHAALFERAPGRDIGVVIKMREHDFIPRTKFTPNGAAHGESQRSHVRAENDLIRITAEEVGHGGPRARDHRIAPATGCISAAGVGVVALQIIGDGIDHSLRNLSAAGTVKKCRWLAVDGLRKRWELGANPGEIEGAGSFSFCRRQVSVRFLKACGRRVADRPLINPSWSYAPAELYR